MTKEIKEKQIEEKREIDVDSLTHDDLAKMLSHRFCIKCSDNIDNEPKGVQYCKKCRGNSKNKWNKEQRKKKLEELGPRICPDCGEELSPDETLNANRCKKCREKKPGHTVRDDRWNALSEEEKLQILNDASQELLKEDKDMEVYEELFKKKIESNLKKREEKWQKNHRGHGSVCRSFRRSERAANDPDFIEKRRAKNMEWYKMKQRKLKNKITIGNFNKNEKQ